MRGNLEPQALLDMARDIIAERGDNYGSIAENFQLIADLATLRLGRTFHPFEICIILTCLKNARNFAVPDHLDSRVDAVNYELMAAQFAADYIAQKASENNIEGYKKREELRPAVVTDLPRQKPAPIKAPLPRAEVQNAIQSALGKLEIPGGDGE